MFGGTRRRGRRGGGGGYLMFMLLQLFAQVQRLERKPPATLAMMGAMIALYLQPELSSSSLGEVCLSPALVLRDLDLFRLVGSAFVHAGDMHLYYNMSSLLWKGVQIELAAGSAAFVAMCATLLVLSHGLVVAVGYVLGPLTGAMPEAFTNCSVGFSGVLFALKVVLNDGSPTHSYVMGMSVPTKYAAWAELVIASMINPRASFLGHLCGIAAGYAWTRGGVGRFVGARLAGGGDGAAERWANPVRVNSAGGFFGGVGDMFGTLFSGEPLHHPPPPPQQQQRNHRNQTYGRGTTGGGNQHDDRNYMPAPGRTRAPADTNHHHNNNSDNNNEDEDLQRALDESRRQFEREQANIRSRHGQGGPASADEMRRRRVARFG